MSWSIDPKLPRDFLLQDIYDVSSAERTGVCSRMSPVVDDSMLSLRVGTVWEAVCLNPSYEHEAPSDSLLASKKIIDIRVEQMGPIRKKKILLDDSQRFFLAETINTILPLCSPDRIWRFKKRRSSPALCSFVVDPQASLCFILGDETIRGVGKKIRDAITLPFDPSVRSFLTSAKVNLTKREGPRGREMVNLWLSWRMFSAFASEVEMISRYQGVFPESYGTFEHESYPPAPYRGSPLCKITRFEAKMIDGSRVRLDRLNDQEQLSFVRQFLHLLAQLWPALHGDVKVSNVLYRPAGWGVEVKLIDLGLAACPRKGALSYIMEEGFYGSVFCTAPEVLGQEPEDVNWYKAESWAVGCALYHWLMGKEIPWGKPLIEYRSGGNLKNSESVLESLQGQVRASLAPMQTMAEVGSCSATAVIARLCLDFLDFDSECRLSVLDAEERLLDYSMRGVPRLPLEKGE